MRFWCSCDHVHHVCADALAHSCCTWLLRAFSLIIAVQILIVNLLTNDWRRVTIRQPLMRILRLTKTRFCDIISQKHSQNRFRTLHQGLDIDELRGFSLFIVLKIRPHILTTNPWNKTIRSHEADAIDLGADFYDHIHDHRHDRSTWRQDATRARTVIFAVAERSEKR